MKPRPRSPRSPRWNSSSDFFDTLLHFGPDRVNELAQFLGPWLYAVIFAIIFAETGLVVTPFLPGDSLLFAVGAVAATPGSPINLTLMAGLLVVAAVLGDAVNYAAGYWIGPKVFNREDSILLNRKHLIRAQEFYDKHGGKTIILARFVPIVRTFAPFVAGIGRMKLPLVRGVQHRGRHGLDLDVPAGGLRLRLEQVRAEAVPPGHRRDHPDLGPAGTLGSRPGAGAAAKGESVLLEATTLGEDPMQP